MAKSKSPKAKSSSATIGFEQQIWDAACELWGHIPAAENIFFVPPEARWSEIAKAAHTPEIGTILDKAMIAIEADNKSLKGVLPKNYANPELDKRVLGNVVDVFTNMDMSDTEASKDLLGRTYEYCIAQFASYEGVKGGEFYTPASVVKTIVNILKPSEGKRVYDPCCGSGGMFVQSVKFIQEHAGNRSNISVFGQEANADTWKMAKMNMAIRGIDANFGDHPEDTFFNDLHSTQKFDFIMANPPFNLSNWGQDKLQNDPRWAYGLPPAGNANYAWIEHMIYHLAPNGKIGLVLANGALTVSSGEEYEIKKRIINANLIEAIISLPAQLFYSTKIKVSIWIISRCKKTSDILFVDAQNLGKMISRTQKEFLDEDIEKISCEVNDFAELKLKCGKQGFSAIADLHQIESKNYNLSPSKYVLGIIKANLDSLYEEEIENDENFISTVRKEYYSNKLFLSKKEVKPTLKSYITDIENLPVDDVEKLLQQSYQVNELKKKCEKRIQDFSGRLFKLWFIDFNFSDENGKPYKLNGGKLIDSEYGLIPEKWKITKMGTILKISSNRVGESTGIPEYSTTNSGISPRSENFNKSLTLNSKNYKIVRKGDIVFGMSREIFNFGVMKDSIGAVSPAYHVYHIDSSNYNPDFLEIYMRLCPDYFLSLIKPGAREGQVLDKDELEDKIILLPPLDLQNKFMILRNSLGNWII